MKQFPLMLAVLVLVGCAKTGTDTNEAATAGTAPAAPRTAASSLGNRHDRQFSSGATVKTGVFEMTTPRSVASGPSFDCANASTGIEKTICANPDLGKADADLATLYRQTLAAAGTGADEVRQGQRTFITVRNQCKDVACIRDAYHLRLVQLTQLGTVREPDRHSASAPSAQATTTGTSATLVSDFEAQEARDTLSGLQGSDDPVSQKQAKEARLTMCQWMKQNNVSKNDRLPYCDDEREAVAKEGELELAAAVENQNKLCAKVTATLGWGCGAPAYDKFCADNASDGDCKIYKQQKQEAEQPEDAQNP